LRIKSTAFLRNLNGKIAANGFGIGVVAEIEAQMFIFVQKLIEELNLNLALQPPLRQYLVSCSPFFSHRCLAFYFVGLWCVGLVALLHFLLALGVV
jgi:hypothetical protein